MHATFRAIQSKVPGHTIGAIKAGKGLERYITGEHAWHQEFSMRHTIVMRRMSQKIEDLGTEEWTNMSRAQQSRKAVPSHIMLCIFYGKQVTTPTPEDEPLSLPKSTAIASHQRDVMPRETSVPVDVPTWTPMTATVSGPKFLSLSEREKSVIQKLHTKALVIRPPRDLRDTCQSPELYNIFQPVHEITFAPVVQNELGPKRPHQVT